MPLPLILRVFKTLLGNGVGIIFNSGNTALVNRVTFLVVSFNKSPLFSKDLITLMSFAS